MSDSGNIFSGELQMAIAVNEMYEYGGFWSPYDSRLGLGIATFKTRSTVQHHYSVHCYFTFHTYCYKSIYTLLITRTLGVNGYDVSCTRYPQITTSEITTSEHRYVHWCSMTSS
ncbi:hypothetical protein L798_04273 [Zootermopsis nevadensis]|uniref:Uncharacterized protein n=1 Tax=Zootermopsis nevadensis TaxID=136037 RepID=A0A067RNJ0_ZOONE|nr:hypothetical protein L798_04273 [Zootermopsis nevadensis]